MRPRIVNFFEAIVGTGVFIPDYAFLYSIAIVLGIYMAIRQAEKAGLDIKKAFRVCLITVGFALIAARGYVVLRHPDYYMHQPLEIFKYWKGGIASFGAYMGGGIAAIAAAKWQRLSTLRFLDCCAPSVALAISLGRLGCFLNGCCYGRISNLPWALRFPEGSGPYYAQLHEGLIGPHQLSLAVHPTQLYEAIYGLILFCVVILYRKYQRHDGELAALVSILYPLGRFFNEFLRTDDRGCVYILSLPQFFSVIVVILAVSFLVMKNRASMLAKSNLDQELAKRQITWSVKG